MKWPLNIKSKAFIASFSLQLLCAFSLRANPNDHLSENDSTPDNPASAFEISWNMKNIEENLKTFEQNTQMIKTLNLSDFEWDSVNKEYKPKDGLRYEDARLLTNRALILDELHDFQKKMDGMAPFISRESKSRFDQLSKKLAEAINEAKNLQALTVAMESDPNLKKLREQTKKDEESAVESLKRAIKLFQQSWPLTQSSASLLGKAETLKGGIDLARSHRETPNLIKSVKEMKEILKKAEKSPAWVLEKDKAMFENFSKYAKALIEDWEKVEIEQQKFLKGERKESELNVSELPNGFNLPSTVPFTLENANETKFTQEESQRIKQQIEHIRNGIRNHLEQSTETIGPNLDIAYRSTLEELNKAEARLNQENLSGSTLTSSFSSGFFNAFSGLDPFSSSSFLRSRPINNGDSANSAGQPSSTPQSNPVPEKQESTPSLSPSNSNSATNNPQESARGLSNNSSPQTSSPADSDGNSGFDSVSGSNTVRNNPSNTGLPGKVPSQVRDRISNLQASGSHQAESPLGQTSSGTGKNGKRARDRSVDIDQGDSIGTNTSVKNNRASGDVYDQNEIGFTNGLASEQARNTGTNSTNLFSPFYNGLSPREIANLKEISSSTLKSSLSNLSNPNGESKNSESDAQTDNYNSAKEAKSVEPSLDNSGFSIRKNKNKRGETTNTVPTRSYGRKEGFADEGLSYSFITNNAVSSASIPSPETTEKNKTNYVMNPNGTFSKAQPRSGGTDTTNYRTNSSLDNPADKETQNYQLVSNDIQEGMRSLAENNGDLDLRTEDTNSWLTSLGLPTTADSLTRIWTELNPMNRTGKPSGLMRFLISKEKPTKFVSSPRTEQNGTRNVASRTKMEASLQDQPTLLSRLLVWLGLSNSQDLGKTDKPQLQ